MGLGAEEEVAFTKLCCIFLHSMTMKKVLKSISDVSHSTTSSIPSF